MRWKLLSGSRVTISPFRQYVSARLRMCGNVSWKSIICPSTKPSSSDADGDAEDRIRDLGAQRGRPEAEALEPERALVEAVQRVLPGEARPAVHLDGALAGPDGCLARERLRRGGCDGRLLVV